MTTYFTSTRTLTLSENDYRTIENMQEEMDENYMEFICLGFICYSTALALLFKIKD